MWGQLEYDSSVTTPTDWSGSLRVERGAIVAARLLAFDRGDHLLRPRGNHQELAWISKTGPHYDGILVFIYDPEPDSFETENTVTLTTEPYSRTLTMSELEHIDEIVDVGENKVSISGFLTAPLECQHGFFQGKWKRLGKGDRGNFHGRWISDDGYLMGHLRGHFGIRDDGEQVLFGKWIGVGGAFRGLLRGEWGFTDALDAESAQTGWFTGGWHNAAGNRVGDFEGDWIAAPPRPQPGNGNGNANGIHRHGHGLWRGQWQEICE
jgi:hypothetical protein